MINVLFSDNLDCVKIKKIRQDAGFSQTEFAKMMNVSIGTLRNWEQGRRKPDGAAVSLLKVFAANPSLTSKALSSFSVSDSYTKEEKKKIIDSINWEYSVDADDLLRKIDSDSDQKNKLFVKTFQYLHWQDVVRFWGLGTCCSMYSQEIRKMIIPSLRGKYDFIYGKILKTNISNAGFSASDSSKLYKSILSYRRHSS